MAALWRWHTTRRLNRPRAATASRKRSVSPYTEKLCPNTFAGRLLLLQYVHVLLSAIGRVARSRSLRSVTFAGSFCSNPTSDNTRQARPPQSGATFARTHIPPRARSNLRSAATAQATHPKRKFANDACRTNPLGDTVLLVCLSPKCQVLHDRFLNAPERKIEGQPLELYHQSGNLRDFLVGAVFAFC